MKKTTLISMTAEKQAELLKIADLLTAPPTGTGAGLAVAGFQIPVLVAVLNKVSNRTDSMIIKENPGKSFKADKGNKEKK